MSINKNLIVMVILLSLSTLLSQKVVVHLEPLPPFIVSEKEGLTIDMLKKIETTTDLKFDIKLAPYSRVKQNLEDKTADLIGHTPYKQEVKEFYSYAQEIEWSLPTIIDIYAFEKEKMEKSAYMKLKKIGTPRGNKEFLSEVLGIPLENFYEGELKNLLKMMKMGRIDAFVFERSSTMHSLDDLKIENVHYKEIGAVSVSLAVQKSDKGDKLYKLLNEAVKDKSIEMIFEEYKKYIELPSEGVK